MIRVMIAAILLLTSVIGTIAGPMKNFTGRTAKITAVVAYKESNGWSYNDGDYLTLKYNFYFGKKGNIYLGKKSESGRILFGGIIRLNKKHCEKWILLNKRPTANFICASYSINNDKITIKLEDRTEEAGASESETLKLTLKSRPGRCIPVVFRTVINWGLAHRGVPGAVFKGINKKVSCDLVKGRKF